MSNGEKGFGLTLNKQQVQSDGVQSFIVPRQLEVVGVGGEGVVNDRDKMHWVSNWMEKIEKRATF